MFSIIRHDQPPLAPAPKAVRSVNFAPEWRLLTEGARLAVALPKLMTLPKGNSRVILIPGWRSPEWSMAPMRSFLRALGYDAQYWGLGMNMGDPERDCERLKEKLLQSFEIDSRPISLVGWSLGGVIAREMARHLPEFVDGVVTYGTPVIGGPSYTLGSLFYPESECLRAQKLVEQLDRDLPIQAPMSCIFSQNDQFVDWPACIDRISPNVLHFEVKTPHITMGLSRAVWQTIATQLHEYGKSNNS